MICVFALVTAAFASLWQGIGIGMLLTTRLREQAFDSGIRPWLVVLHDGRCSLIPLRVAIDQ